MNKEVFSKEGLASLVGKFDEVGDAFERKAVHVLHSDRGIAIVAHDGSIMPGYAFAMNAAAQLNWALKTQAGAGPDEGHHHH